MENTGRSAFGERLVKARKHAEMTQINAAKTVKMSQGTLAELENDGVGSSYTAQLADVYGVDANWLATGKGKMLPGNLTGSDAAADQPAATTYPDHLIEASQLAKLIELFSKSTAQGRLQILDAAEVSDKIPVGRSRKSTHDKAK